MRTVDAITTIVMTPAEEQEWGDPQLLPALVAALSPFVHQINRHPDLALRSLELLGQISMVQKRGDSSQTPQAAIAADSMLWAAVPQLLLGANGAGGGGEGDQQAAPQDAARQHRSSSSGFVASDALRAQCWAAFLLLHAVDVGDPEVVPPVDLTELLGAAVDALTTQADCVFGGIGSSASGSRAAGSSSDQIRSIRIDLICNLTEALHHCLKEEGGNGSPGRLQPPQSSSSSTSSARGAFRSAAIAALTANGGRSRRVVRVVAERLASEDGNFAESISAAQAIEHCLDLEMEGQQAGAARQQQQQQQPLRGVGPETGTSSMAGHSSGSSAAASGGGDGTAADAAGTAAAADRHQKACMHCGKTKRDPGVKLRVCLGCNAAWACGKECQRLGWGVHRAACTAAQTARTGQQGVQ